MSATDGVEIGLGVVLVSVTLYDVFESVVMPRPAVGRVRLSLTLIRVGWRVWRTVAKRPRKLQTREAALAAYAPMAMVALLVLWGFALILGYALIYTGLRDGLHPQPASLGATLYFSTGRMLAFPVGGIEATGTAAQILTGIEAASGFGLFALVISLLFSLFSSFQRRETAVVALDALAGAPPSGVQLLETCARDGMPEQLATTFEQWRMWTVDVLESHLSYPLLFYFRSSHDNDAWPNSFGAVMDAATLVLSTVEGVRWGRRGSCTRSELTWSPTCGTITTPTRSRVLPGWSATSSSKHAAASRMRATGCASWTGLGNSSARCGRGTPHGST